MTTRPFRIIGVFPSERRQSGNPLAVVLEAEGGLWIGGRAVVTVRGDVEI